MHAVDPSEFGPGAAKIDTRAPFRIHAAFEADALGEFASLTITLEQVLTLAATTEHPLHANRLLNILRAEAG